MIRNNSNNEQELKYEVLLLVEDLFPLFPSVFCIQLLLALWELLKHLIRRMTCPLAPPNNELHLHCKKIFFQLLLSFIYAHYWHKHNSCSYILSHGFYSPGEHCLICALYETTNLFLLLSILKCILYNKPSFVANKGS